MLQIPLWTRVVFIHISNAKSKKNHRKGGAHGARQMCFETIKVLEGRVINQLKQQSSNLLWWIRCNISNQNIQWQKADVSSSAKGGVNEFHIQLHSFLSTGFINDIHFVQKHHGNHATARTAISPPTEQ